MTIREKLADWISGGALSEVTKLYHEEVAENSKNCAKMMRYGFSLIDIECATASGKSGTAKKIHRMATEALTIRAD